tara:strand:+ start:343 stop:789 length:447 start_codon:yes stop_codon:yes gene_type:complete
MDPDGEIWFIPVIVIIGILVTPTLLDDPEIDGTTVGSQDDQLIDNAVNVVILVGGVAAARYCLKPCIDAVIKRKAIADATRMLDNARRRLFWFAQRVERLEAQIERARRVGDAQAAMRLERALGGALERRIHLQAVVDALRKALECLK